MRYLPFICLFLLSASFASAQSDPKLRAELLAMHERDQSTRDACLTGTAEDQAKCFFKIAQEVDEPNTKRMREILDTQGFPTVEQVGKDGVGAFVTMLQHVRGIDVREKSAKGMKNAYKKKVITPFQYAGFTDRLLISQKKPQLYGSNFETKDGKLVMPPVQDPKNLAARRKKMGLPTIEEYAKELGEMYKLEVVIPNP